MSANVDFHCHSDANAKDIERRSAPKQGLPVSTVPHGRGAHPRWGFRAPSSGLWTEYLEVVGLPTVLLRERKRQYRRKPCPCHPTTVSGLTIRSGLDQFGHSRRSVTQNTRSEWRKRARLVRRFKTINWCRKATISSPRSWRDRTKPCSQVDTAVISQSINSPLYQDEHSHC
jgi:hypothetical protein